MEERNCKWFSELLGLKGLMPGTAYKVRVGAEGASGIVSSEDVFETGPGEAHNMHAQR